MMRLFALLAGLVVTVMVTVMIAGSLHSGSSLYSSSSPCFEQPAIQISWMQSSARPRWGGGQ